MIDAVEREKPEFDYVIAHLMDPKFVDVICTRYEAFTGKKPQRSAA